VAGDRATPEGRYRVLKKRPASKFYRALLIDYPNAEDEQRFRDAKRHGLIASSAGIGGLIEIHGGGIAGMTYGCVALENPAMSELFSLVGEGTPVTIVGALDGENAVARALREYRGER
jgi:murein L,D-transpeptidase YafK